MRLNQYAVYQLKADVSVRHLRYKSYQYLLENQLRVDAENYQQVYITTMHRRKNRKKSEASWKRNCR